MSSLKDIMDVDVEPLESQAYRRSREAAEQQEVSRRSIISPASATPSPPVDDGKGKAPVRRRRSNQVSKVPGQSTAPRSGAGRRRSSATSDAMDYTPTIHPGGSAQESMSGSPRHSSRSSEPAAEMPVKYTPVTGRISRAKKGVPVHTCEICRPAKTFTRAEHLRRHQLSHQKPAYPCTFEDCERVFHRPDLLARHLNRHETQGEKAYRSGDRRSRASSSASENHEPLLKVETPQEDNPTSKFQVSSEHSTTSNPTVSSSEDPTATSQIGRGPGSFDPVNFSASSQKTPSSGGPARRGDGGGTSRPPRSTPPRSTYEQMTSSFSVRPTVENGNQGIYSGHMSQVLEVASETEEQSFPGYPASHVLPNLRIPEDSFLPGLSYTQESSPWCSSASDSTYSTQSDTWIRRGRSASIATIPDWPGQTLATQWPSNTNSTSTHELRSPAFGAIAEHYPTPFTSPGISPSTSSQVLLDVPVFGGYYMESVGTPTLSTVNNSFAQLVPASPSRISSSRLGSASRRSKELVESQLAGSIPSGLASGHLISSQFDTYLSDYRQFFDPLFPIIHHPTFNFSADPLPVLAMVAIGTRYSDRPEARKLGMAIHDHCRRSIDLCATWTLSTMQAILLTEIFERFHGKKPHVRRSQLFEGLYNRLLREPCEVWQVQQPQNPTLQQSDVDVQWMQWVDAEARRRLFSACFVFDTHQSLYYEQHRSNGQQLDTILSLIYIPCPRKPWDARDSKAWQTEWQTEPNNQPNRLVEQFPANDILCQSPFTQALIICFIACQLPTRDHHKIPDQFSPSLANCQPLSLLAELPSTPLANTYLALYHTPLHDLLGVAGDTWVFGRKITPLSAFESTQARLKTWSSSLAAAVATQYACRVLQTSLSNTQRCNGGLFISDYWSLYVSALICWAFGHRYQSGGSGTNSRSNSSMATDRDPKNGAVEAARTSALDYTSAMLALSPRELLSNKANVKGETSGIIDAVRTRLEIDGIGSHSMTIVDAIGVLTRLKEVGRGKYF